MNLAINCQLIYCKPFITRIYWYYFGFEAARSGHLAPHMEEGALIPGNRGKPADIFIPHWTGGKDTALDVTVVHPLTPSRLSTSAESPGSTLETAFKNKCRNTEDACAQEGIIFLPLPEESLGGWHPKALAELKRLARAQARARGGKEDEASRHLLQRLSVLLMKGNSALLSLRDPSHPPAP